MTTVALLSLVEQVGGVLSLRDDRVLCDLPEDAAHLISELRQRRDDILQLLQQRLATSLRQWLSTQCVASVGCACNPDILYREFIAWAGLVCSETSFLAELQRLGFGQDADGMVAGLALGADFFAACQYERSRCT
jgi:hypothetical protein